MNISQRRESPLFDQYEDGGNKQTDEDIYVKASSNVNYETSDVMLEPNPTCSCIYQNQIQESLLFYEPLDILTSDDRSKVIKPYEEPNNDVGKEEFSLKVKKIQELLSPNHYLDCTSNVVSPQQPVTNLHDINFNDLNVTAFSENNSDGFGYLHPVSTNFKNTSDAGIEYDCIIEYENIPQGIEPLTVSGLEQDAYISLTSRPFSVIPLAIYEDLNVNARNTKSSSISSRGRIGIWVSMIVLVLTVIVVIVITVTTMVVLNQRKDKNISELYVYNIFNR